MSQLLNPDYHTEETTDESSTFTAAEIERQPVTWKKVWGKIQEKSDPLAFFLNTLKDISDLNIVLTGAGSSAFIGDTVSSSWLKNFSSHTQAIPTTDLVTHFEDRIAINKPLLLISFARSGNSPESTATIQRANELCEQVYHLIITCNPDGKLAQMESRDNTYVFFLPREAEDQSLAMTNSFTSMALAATLIPQLLTQKRNFLNTQIELLTSYGTALLDEYSSVLYEVAQQDYNRIVFLGSGLQWGIAKESHLKVQELTNGRIIGKFDSFLGFRHGPKAIINDETLVVYLLSNNEQTNRYEKDLINQIAQHGIDLTTAAISETNCLTSNIDFNINLGDSRKIADEFWAILCTLPAQIIGFYKSLMFGYNPDNPSPNGTIARVVEGVTIYNNTSKSQKNQVQ